MSSLRVVMRWPKSLTLSILMLIAALFACPSVPAQGETLTNADVVKLVQAHLGVDVIVEQIRANAGNYTLTTQSLLQLKEAGVPDKVIAAMQEKKKGHVPSSAVPAPRQSASHGRLKPGVEAQKGWRVAWNENGSKRWEASTTVATNYEQRTGEAGIVASCEQENVTFEVTYRSQSDTSSAFLQRQGDSYVTTPMKTATIMGITVTAPDRNSAVIHPGASYVSFRTALGDNWDTQSSSSDFQNRLTAKFKSEPAFYSGHDLKFELPLADGD